MANYNRVILVGRLTRDVELKCTPSGTPVTDLGLAVSERRKTANGEWVDEPLFIDVTLWGRTAEVASEYLSKGSPVLIEGRLKLHQWEADGQKRSKIRVVGERMQMLGTRGTSNGASGGSTARPMSQAAPAQAAFGEPAATQMGAEPTPSTPPQAGGPPEDDIPF